MKILAVGGGSGGHVTPVVAVLRELKAHHEAVEIRFWCDRKFAPQARSIVHNFDPELRIDTIFSGKFRRYHHLTWWQHLLIPSVVFPNIRDIFLAVIGLIQSIVKLMVWRPDVVFTKGGFVCLPVGLAAKLLKIPLVIHDSDSHPGLTNRILAKWATAIATGAPLHYYPYNKRISRYVGIPIARDFRPYSEAERAASKTELGFNPSKPLIVVTGGGLGSKRVNDAVAKRLSALMELGSVMLLSGTEQYDDLRALTPQDDSRFQLHAFISEGMARVLGAADVVVSRAGATTVLELSSLAKPTILIPNGRLTGGHQLKNAAEYAKTNAVEVILEHELDSNPQLLVDTLSSLLSNPARMRQMSKAFYAFARPSAGADMADIIYKAAAK
jgi:UDP-N-acetylglucosamine--N-acetylmuramyl-(pentapeptide) pyrophosphoryl-undecaprenol N-acetylglucosamine transferase